MKTAVLQEALFSFVNFVPYEVFIVYAFHSDLKVSKRVAWLIMLAAGIVETVFWLSAETPSSYATHIFSLIITIGSFLAYIAVVKINVFHATFRLLVVNNVANYIVVASKFLEGLLFPENAAELTCWTYSFCMGMIQVVVLGTGAFYLSRRSYKKCTDGIDPSIWKNMCLIPVTFYMIWHYVLYRTPNKSSMEMALDPLHMVFQTIVLGGQLLIYLCVYKLVNTYSQLIEVDEENNKLNMQAVAYHSIQRSINEARIMRHDMRHHLQIISEYAENENIEELRQYLQQYTERLNSEVQISYCENITLNMLLAYYGQICKENDIQFNVQMSLPNKWVLADSETVVLFGNLLENACDACLQQKTGARQVSVYGKKGNAYIFTIDNTFSNELIKDSQNRFMSTKHSGYGLGTASAYNIVTEHQGNIRFETQQEKFCVSIMIPAAD